MAVGEGGRGRREVIGGGEGGGGCGFALRGDFALDVLEGFAPVGLEVWVTERPTLQTEY